MKLLNEITESDEGMGVSAQWWRVHGLEIFCDLVDFWKFGEIEILMIFVKIDEFREMRKVNGMGVRED
jgi:hypothetical protein